MRRPFITSLLLLTFGWISAQQLDLTTLYRYNWQVLNPAAVNHVFLEDKRKQYVFNSSFRQQWIGFEGAPASYTARFEYLPDSENAAAKFGFFASGDQAGSIETNKFFGNFAYLIYFKRSVVSESYLSIGMNLGMVRYHVDFNEIRFQDDQQNIPVDGILNQSYADMALGCFYRLKTYDSSYRTSFRLAEFYAGLSVPQTFTMNLKTPKDGAFQLDRVQHFYIITGGVFTITRQLRVEPSFWLRYVPKNSFQTLFNNAPLSGDLNVRVQYDRRFWGGIGASTNRLMHVEAGFTIGQVDQCSDCKNYIITLGLAYDAPIGWNSWLGPSAEISLGIGWN